MPIGEATNPSYASTTMDGVTLPSPPVLLCLPPVVHRLILNPFEALRDTIFKGGADFFLENFFLEILGLLSRHKAFFLFNCLCF